MAHRNIRDVIYDLLFMHRLGFFSSVWRGRTTSHQRGYDPLCQGALLDPEDLMHPTPQSTVLPCSPL